MRKIMFGAVLVVICVGWSNDSAQAWFIKDTVGEYTEFNIDSGVYADVDPNAVFAAFSDTPELIDIFKERVVRVEAAYKFSRSGIDKLEIDEYYVIGRTDLGNVLWLILAWEDRLLEPDLRVQALAFVNMFEWESKAAMVRDRLIPRPVAQDFKPKDCLYRFDNGYSFWGKYFEKYSERVNSDFWENTSQIIPKKQKSKKHDK